MPWPRRGAVWGLQTLTRQTRRRGVSPQSPSRVRAKAHRALLALEVNSREVEERGFQQGICAPATIYKLRVSLGMQLRAAFLTLLQ